MPITPYRPKWKGAMTDRERGGSFNVYFKPW